jgi:VanZ family protein
MTHLKAARIVGWFLAATIVLLSVVPAPLRPETNVPHKFEHFIIFFVTGVAFGMGYNPKRGLLAALLFAFAGCVELIQLFVPGRHARITDFIVDALAICFGSVLVSLLQFRA